MSSKPVTVLVYLGRGEQGKQRLERWKQAAEEANVTHCGKPAVGKWLKELAVRETSKDCQCADCALCKAGLPF